jgi:glycosyltransferase involved in cell wall biosynthesis
MLARDSIMPEPTGKRSVLILSGVKGDTRRYRTFHPYEQLRLAGVDCQLSHITDPDLPEKARQAGLVILHRLAMDRYVESLLASWQQRGTVVLLDVDDLVFEPHAFQWINSPDFADPLRATIYQEEMHRQQLVFDACQAVTASTDFLAMFVRQQDKPVWVHRNAFSLEMLSRAEAAFSRRQAGAGRLVIGYASGTPTHNGDFALVKPALKNILRQYPQAEVWLIGPLDPGRDWGSLAPRIRRFPLVPWRELPEHLVRFDINLAPLVMDNPFAQSKSEIKYMEAALVRVPTIASPTDAYRFAIHPGENGLLAASDSEWEQALTHLIEQPELRRAMGEMAYTKVLQGYHPQIRAAELVSLLDQVSIHLLGAPFWEHDLNSTPASQAGMSASLPKDFCIDPELERNPTLAKRAIYSIRYRGLRTLLIQIWIYFRRLFAPIFPFKSARS